MLYIVCGVAGLVVGAIVGIFIGQWMRKKTAEAKIGSAEQEAKRLLDESIKNAEAKKKETLLEAKEEILRLRNEADKDIKDRRNEIARTEHRLSQKEDNLDNKSEALERKAEALEEKVKENEAIKQQQQLILTEQIKKLETISGFTAEQAKQELLQTLEGEIRHDMAQKIASLEAEYKDTAEEKARNLITLAIQRCAADQVTEATVSVVTLPSDDMKGRIIGREGRNIQKIEQLTGVELIIDDTPEAITVSGFDPVRREVARLALEKLIADGRIHPTRIEETVEKAKKEVEAIVKQAGEKAVIDANVHGLHPDVVRQLGRMRYRTSYGQNVLQHSVEVAWIAGMIADELGIDATIARRAGLLHDIGKSFPQDVEGSHVQLGVEYLKKYKENAEVLHAVEAHHFDVEPHTLVAMVVQAADAVSAARPGARREDLENYIKRLQKLEEIATGFDGVDKAYAIQAGREIRVMVKPDVINDDKMILVAHDMAKKIEDEMKYPGQIKINIIRETRAVDYAK